MKRLRYLLVSAFVGLNLFSNFAPVQAAVPRITINEIQCAGTDWIELYNPGVEAVDISGWLLTDKPIDSGKNTYFFPNRSIIAAKKYLTVYQGTSGNVLSFGVGCTKGDIVRLAARTGAIFTLVDSVSTPALAAGVGYGRVPNGTGNFGLTIAKANSANTTALPVLSSSRIITCTKLKVCSAQITASSGVTVRLTSAIKGVSVNTSKKVIITARKAQKMFVNITLTNKYGSKVEKLAITIK